MPAVATGGESPRKKAIEGKQWLPQSAAARLLDATPAYIRQLALDGRVGTLRLPGRAIKFNRGDVVKILAEGTKQAD